MRFGFRHFTGLFVWLSLFALTPAAADPIKLGYSDWPGWVAWEVAVQKGWLQEDGLDVTLEWFDYVASMDAFSAGQIDGVMITNGDALVIGAGGAKGVMVLVTDYSNGNDMIVARPEISTFADLKGKKVGLEVGFVEHLMLLRALEDNGMTESDIELVNVKTNETPQVLASGQVDAIGAWQPNSGQAMKLVPGAHPVYTSAEAPGLIYDTIYVSPANLAANHDAYVKLAKVWDKVVKYINDSATTDDAVAIMAARVGLTPEEYKPLLAGTRLLDIAEGVAVFAEAEGLASIYGSSVIADAFNVDNGVYSESQDIKAYIDPSVTSDATE